MAMAGREAEGAGEAGQGKPGGGRGGGVPRGSRTHPVAATVVDVSSGWRISSPALRGEGMSPKTSTVSMGREEPWEAKAAAGR